MSRLTYLVPVRFLCALALAAAFSGVMRLLPDEGDGANIGAGLLLFALLWAMAFGWSLFDARRRGFAISIVAWALVGLLIGIAFPISIAIADSDWDSTVLRSDLSFFIPFWLSSVTVLAAIGAAIGNSLRTQPTN
ncbi:hypothetical protein ACLM5J_20665 [Nocardioides sp. Bht2]|uniref:hypothetical protein n=1 Tax=Nocardioides sp. Bht2 TaxID=3392297 RepID=UPI0039B61EE4